jgi:hypothetical protein
MSVESSPGCQPPACQAEYKYGVGLWIRVNTLFTCLCYAHVRKTKSSRQIETFLSYRNLCMDRKVVAHSTVPHVRNLLHQRCPLSFPSASGNSLQTLHSPQFATIWDLHELHTSFNATSSQKIIMHNSLILNIRCSRRRVWRWLASGMLRHLVS